MKKIRNKEQKHKQKSCVQGVCEICAHACRVCMCVVCALCWVCVHVCRMYA